MKKLPQGNCPFCDSERGLPSVWGMSPAGYGALKDEHDAGHPNYNPFSRDVEEVEVEKCEICSHEICSFCHECHNMDCDTFFRPLNKCFDSLLPKKSQPPASEGWERPLHISADALLECEMRTKELIRQTRQEAKAEVVGEIIELVQQNHKGTFTDEGGNDCWYISDLVKALSHLQAKTPPQAEE